MTQTRRRRSTASKASKKPAGLFPTKLVLQWSDGSTEELHFTEPRMSPRGNQNSHAGEKLVRQGKILRINCNVTESRG